MSGETSHKPPKLTRKGNWSAWSLKIRAHLDSRAVPLSQYLDRDPDDTDEAKKIDRQVKSILLLAVEDALTTVIGQASSAHDAFSRLTNDMQAHLRVRKIEILQTVSAISQSHEQSVAEYTQNAVELMCEAVDLEHFGAAEMLCSKYIGGLRGDVKQSIGGVLLQTLSNHSITDISTAETALQDLIQQTKYSSSVLLGSDNDMSSQADERAGIAFQVNAPYQPPANQAPRDNRQPRDDRQPPRSQMRQRRCYYCQKEGHLKRNCPDFIADKQKLPAQNANAPRQFDQSCAKQKEQGQAHAVAAEQEQLFDFIRQLKRHVVPADDGVSSPHGGVYCCKAVATSRHMVKKDGHIRDVYLDGAATHHVVMSTKYLFGLRTSPINTVVTAGGEQHTVTCCGDLQLLREGQLPIIIMQVLCVPTFYVNLISETQLTSKGFDVHKHASRATVYLADGGDNSVLLEGELVQNLYRLKVTINMGSVQMPAAAYAAMKPQSLLLHHQRLGHANLRACKELISSNAVLGVSHQLTHDVDACVVCQESKAKRNTYPPYASRAQRPCAIIHTDLMGPFYVSSIGGSLYALTIVDDYSGYGAVMPLKRKYEAAEQVKLIILEWQRQSGFLVKRLHCDRGTEFQKTLKVFMQHEGIQHITSPSYTPEQNGRIERYNKTILGVVRCMLRQFRLPPKLWSEAMMYAAHVRNMIPRQGEKCTPTEAFLGVKPDISMLRVFGCKAVVAKPIHKRKKLHVQGEICIFMGMSLGGKGWRLLSWETGKLTSIESSDVIFHESETALPVKYGGAAPSPAVLPADESDDDDTYSSYELIHLPHMPPTEDPAAVKGAVAAEGVAAAPSDHDDVAAEESGDNDAAVEADAAAHSDLFDSDAESQWDLEESAAGQIAAEVSEHEDPAEHDPAEPRRSGRVTAVPARLHMNHLGGGMAVMGRPHHAGAFKVLGRKSTWDEPQSMQECRMRPDAARWEQAWNDELAALQQMGTYHEVDPASVPTSARILRSRLVFKIKRNEYDEIEKYKCRMVARGDQQVEGFDFFDVHAPTAQSATFRVLLALAAQHDFVMHQLDVTTAFLHGDLTEEVYISPPHGVGLNDKIWKLDKALYGLRQAARAWNSKLSDVLHQIGFRQCHSDPCLFVKGEHSDVVYALFHVDDAIVVGNLNKVSTAVDSIGDVFTIKKLGNVKYFLGIEVFYSAHGFAVTQQAYCQRLLEKFGMSDCNARVTPFPQGLSLVKEGEALGRTEHDTYRSIIGGLLYLSVHTRFDIAFQVGKLARYMSAPTKHHLGAAHHVLRYLKGTTRMAVHFPRLKEGPSFTSIRAYTDADLAGDKATLKSTTGMVIKMNDAPIMWVSRLQSLVTTSTAESELVAAASGAKELLWLRKLLAEAEPWRQRNIVLYCDNEATVSLVRNTTAGINGRSKHIDLQFAFVRERFVDGVFDIQHVSTELQLADLFTKLLPRPRLLTLSNLIGIVNGDKMISLGYAAPTVECQ
jgi:Reverse transcriptase (RNA-dependent DNA polymerase)/Integrase core domain/GAG-pre-integrase domain/Zinc knuckle